MAATCVVVLLVCFNLVAVCCVFARYLGLRSAEALWRRGWIALREIAYSALLVAASGAATVLTPYGIELLRWLAHDLGPPRPEISEWGALAVNEIRFVPFVALVALSTAGWLPSRRPRDPVQAVLLAATAFQPVAFDGRFRTCYPQEIADMHFDFIWVTWRIGGGGVPRRPPSMEPECSRSGDRIWCW